MSRLMLVAALCCVFGAVQLSAQASVSTGAQTYSTAPGNSYIDEYYFDVDFGSGVSAGDLSINITNTGNLVSTMHIAITDPLASLAGVSELPNYNFANTEGNGIVTLAYGQSGSPVGPGTTGVTPIWGPSSALGAPFQGSFPLAGVVRFDVFIQVYGSGSTFPQDITVEFSTSAGSVVSNAGFPAPVGTNMGYNNWTQVAPTTTGLAGGWGKAGNSDYFQRNHSNLVWGATRFGSATDEMEFFIDVDMGSATNTLEVGLGGFAFAQPGSATGSCITELYDMQVGWDTPVASTTATIGSGTGLANGDYASYTTGSVTGLVRFRVVMKGSNLQNVSYGSSTVADFGFELYFSNEGQAQSVTTDPVIASPRMAITPAGSTLTTSPQTLTASGGTPTVTYNWTIEGATPTGVSLSSATGTTTNLVFGSSTPMSSTVTVRCTNGAGPEFTEETYTLNFSGSSGGGTVSVSAVTSPAAEPSTNGSWTLTFSTATTAATNVSYTLTGGATAGTASPADYSVSSSAGTASLTGITGIPASTTTVTVTLTVIDDGTVEGNEDAILTLTGATSGYTVGTPAAGTVTINDDDSTPSNPAISVSSSGSPSETGPTSGTFTISASPAPSSPVTVNVLFSGTATNPADYTVTGVTGGQVTVPTSGSVTVTITPVDDSATESAETVILTIDTGTGYTVGSQSSATLSIADNDAPIPPLTGGGGGGGGGGCVAIADESPWLLALGLLAMLGLAFRFRARRE